MPTKRPHDERLPERISTASSMSDKTVSTDAFADAYAVRNKTGRAKASKPGSLACTRRQIEAEDRHLQLSQRSNPDFLSFISALP
jgi:hypothetical protein